MMTATNQDPARYSGAVIASALRSRMQGKRTLLECMAFYKASSSPPADVTRKRPSNEQIRHFDDGCLLPPSRRTMRVVQAAVSLGGACLGVLTGGGGEEETGPSNDGEESHQESHQDIRLQGPSALCSWVANLVHFHGRSLEHIMYQPRLKCYSHD
jgi:hypothetical protein